MTSRPSLFDFIGSDAASQWRVINDGVMGGVSLSRFEITGRHTFLFTGTLSLANSGGFASVRTQARELGLRAGDVLVTRLRGGGCPSSSSIP